ncbi:hypothetical protein U0070_021625 [Myodes glareolus]|uniref:Uncharacterized protein n=1 Tax=Myodes glareolus TaxID=447135 RepID=A0AAW0I0S9_MYOGA
MGERDYHSNHHSICGMFQTTGAGMGKSGWPVQPFYSQLPVPWGLGSLQRECSR